MTPLNLFGQIQRLDSFQKTAVSLWMLVGSFITLVPGGLIENRDFSHLNYWVFWGFNGFLLILCLAGLGTSYGLLQRRYWGAWGALGVAWLYLGVFIVDWAQVFPTSPDPMGIGLCLVEFFCAICCVYVLIFGHRTLGHFQEPEF